MTFHPVNGRPHANAAGIGGALAIVIIAVLVNGLGWHIDATLGAAIGAITAYVAAWLPKPPHK